MRSDYLRPWLPLIFAATAYLTLITRMASLFRDSDLYWHITVGQWIIDHRAIPHVDLFSFTMRGARFSENQEGTQSPQRPQSPK